MARRDEQPTHDPQGPSPDFVDVRRRYYGGSEEEETRDAAGHEGTGGGAQARLGEKERGEEEDLRRNCRSVSQNREYCEE